MKILFLIAFTFTASSLFSQKILLDKKDPFTGVRNVASDFFNVHSFGKNVALKGMWQLELSDTSTIIKLSFVNEIFGNVSSSDTNHKKEVLFKTDDGRTIIGEFILSSKSDYQTIGKYESSTFSLSKQTLIYLGESKVVAIKFSGDFNHRMLVELTEKEQSFFQNSVNNILNKYIK